jgi:predicted esterase
MVTELIDNEAKLVGGADRILIGGFSQGAAMSLHAGLRYPQKLAGIVACSGYVGTYSLFPFLHP